MEPSLLIDRSKNGHLHVGDKFVTNDLASKIESIIGGELSKGILSETENMVLLFSCPVLV